MSLTVLLVAVTAILTSASSWAAVFTNADLHGPIRCGTTFYAWPVASDALPMEVANGFVEVSGDGHGKWTKGILREETVGGADSSSSHQVCNYELAAGRYIVKSNGTAVSTTSWKAVAANNSQCASFPPDLFANGRAAKVSKSAGPTAASVGVLLTAPNSGYRMAVGPAGFATGTCAGADQ
jgi:hypothetical protein